MSPRVKVIVCVRARVRLRVMVRVSARAMARLWVTVTRCTSWSSCEKRLLVAEVQG